MAVSKSKLWEAQLRHWQHETVQRAGLDELRPWFAGLVPAAAEDAFLALVRGNITLPAEAQHWARVVFVDGQAAGSELARDCFPDAAAHAAFFAALSAAYEEHGANVKALGAAVLAATGAKGKGFFLPLRLALTGGHAGPELQPLLALLPPAIVRARLLVQNAPPAG
jgi:glutamyl-tRNA synthetase